MKKLFLAMFFVLIAGLTLTGCGKVVINQDNKPDDENVIVGGDKDEHGCIGSAGYSWCALKEKCLRVWEEVCDEELTNKLQQLFVTKYQKKANEVKVTILLSDANHVRGSVLFNTGESGEGGYFFAAKVDNKWQIVLDGNGGISCALLRQYGFPENMMADCAEE